MGGDPGYNTDAQPLKDLTVGQAKQLFRDITKDLAELKQENEMAKEKDGQSMSGVNRHKRMAEGEKIELKKGGMAKKEKAKAKKK